MGRARAKKHSSISKTGSFEELGEFWDSHSLDDHWDQTKEATFELRATRRRRVTIAPDLYDRVEALAHRRGVSPEPLLNLWLAEHVGSK